MKRTTTKAKATASPKKTSPNATAPKGTSPEIIATLNRAAHEALKHPDVAKRLEAVACVPNPTTPEQLAKMIADDRATWKPIVEEYKLRVT